MLRSSFTPIIRAMRSAWSPAQFTMRFAETSPSVVSTWSLPPRRTMASTRAPVTSSAPFSTASAA